MATETGEADPLQTGRMLVSRGHAAVATGRYPDAMSAFRGALPLLRDALGDDHPEVEELVDDVRTVAEMAGVADFLDAAKLRMPGDLPDLGDEAGGG